MKLRTKRTLSVIAVLIGVGAIVMAALIGVFSGNVERVALFQVQARITGDGTAQVREAIDYNFGAVSSDKHGIYRTVPGLGPDANISVRSADAPDQLQVTNEVEGRKIKIGDPKETISGAHRYEIGYRIGGLLFGDELAFDVVGAAWDVPIRSATIDIAVPWAATDVRCDRGRTGDTGGCEAEQVTPGHLRVAVDKLAKGEGVTLYATPGEKLAAPPALAGFRAPPIDDSLATEVPPSAPTCKRPRAGHQCRYPARFSRTANGSTLRRLRIWPPRSSCRRLA